MNHTNAEKMRLRWETTDGTSREAAFATKPHDTEDTVYDIPLSSGGTLRRLALEISADTPVTGTIRLDYFLLGDRTANPSTL